MPDWLLSIAILVAYVPLIGTPIVFGTYAVKYLRNKSRA